MRSFPILNIVPSSDSLVPSTFEIGLDQSNSFHGREWIDGIGNTFPFYTYSSVVGAPNPPPIGTGVLIGTTFEVVDNPKYNGKYTVFTKATLTSFDSIELTIGGNTLIRVNEPLVPGGGAELTTGRITAISTFVIRAFSETPLVVLERQNIQNRPVEFMGHQTTGWGEVVFQNMVNITANFASIIPPQNPFYGQLWYTTDGSGLKVWTIANIWEPINVLEDGTVSTNKLADGAVSTNKLADGAVTALKMAPNSIGASQIINNSITANKISISTLSSLSADLGNITAGNLTLGTAPTIFGSSMTGSGAIINTNGTFAIGTASRNMTFNGSTVKLNGFYSANTVSAGGQVLLTGGTASSFTTVFAEQSFTRQSDILRLSVGAQTEITSNISANSDVLTLTMQPVITDALNVPVPGVTVQALSWSDRFTGNLANNIDVNPTWIVAFPPGAISTGLKVRWQLTMLLFRIPALAVITPPAVTGITASWYIIREEMPA